MRAVLFERLVGVRVLMTWGPTSGLAETAKGALWHEPEAAAVAMTAVTAARRGAATVRTAARIGASSAVAGVPASTAR